MIFIYTTPQGDMHVVHVAPKERTHPTLSSLPDDEYKQHILSLMPADAINLTQLDDNYVLPDMEFRNAWIQNGKGISHDFEKAKQIQLTKLRFERDALLTKYDGLHARAKDIGTRDDAKKVQAIKQQLRDATTALKNSAPASIDEIKSLTPNLKEITNG